jgi:group I intron endonuclease
MGATNRDPIPGIYVISNFTTGGFYIGRSIDVVRRLTQHRGLLRRHAHINNHLQASWEKYGEGVFSFATLEVVSDESLLAQREAWWCETLRAMGQFGYNQGEVDPDGVIRHSAETREKMAGSQKGRRHTPETIARMRLAAVEREAAKWADPVQAAALRQAISEKTKGRKHTEEWKRANSERMRERVYTDEMRANMSAAQKKVIKDPEVARRTGEKLRGRKQTPEHIAKVREGMRRARAARLAQQDLETQENI